jgi:hypothetical protein
LICHLRQGRKGVRLARYSASLALIVRSFIRLAAD